MPISDKDLNKARSNIANGNLDAISFQVGTGTTGVVAENLPRGYEVSRTGVGGYTLQLPAAQYTTVLVTCDSEPNITVDFSTAPDGYVVIAIPADPVSVTNFYALVALGDVS